MPPSSSRQKIKLEKGFPYVDPPFPLHGTRDDAQPETGKESIVCMGCSHTYGHTAADEAWPAFLQKRIGKDRQVLNMGRRNYGLELVIRWYEHFAAPLSPSACVIQVPLFCRQPLPDLQPDDVENYTMRYGPFGLYRRGKVRKSTFILKSNKMFDRDLARLKEFIRRLEENSTLPIILPYRTPVVNHGFSELGTLVDLYYDEVLRLAEKLGIPACRSPLLSNREFSRRDWLLDTTHPNARGNEFIADQVHEVLP